MAAGEWSPLLVSRRQPRQSLHTPLSQGVRLKDTPPQARTREPGQEGVATWYPKGAGPSVASVEPRGSPEAGKGVPYGVWGHQGAMLCIGCSRLSGLQKTKVLVGDAAFWEVQAMVRTEPKSFLEAPAPLTQELCVLHLTLQVHLQVHFQVTAPGAGRVPTAQSLIRGFHSGSEWAGTCTLGVAVYSYTHTPCSLYRWRTYQCPGHWTSHGPVGALSATPAPWRRGKGTEDTQNSILGKQKKNPKPGALEEPWVLAVFLLSVASIPVGRH